jgi:hypothetical protein
VPCDSVLANYNLIGELKVKKTTFFLALVLCLFSIGCSSTPSTTEVKEAKDDTATFFTEYQNTVNVVSQKVLANDYAGAKALLASQKASLQGKCQAVRAGGGNYPYQITMKTVAAKATLEDAIARSPSAQAQLSTGGIDMENAENSNKVNEQRELMTEFNAICR